MFLSEPQRTSYDLHFEIFGIPVRVHPLFWLVTVIMGLMGGTNAENVAVRLLIWIMAVFVSILVHELGHAFTMRFFGERARVVLYSFGGLAIPDVSPFSVGYGRGRSPREQILISLAGPGAGFLLAGVMVGLSYALHAKVYVLMLLGFIPFPIVTGIDNAYLGMLVNDMLWVNVFWGLMNLMPVYPLDGGQVSREFFMVYNRRDGLRQSLWLSIFTAGGLAVVSLALMKENGFYLALLFGSLAFGSFQILQQISGRGGGFGGGNPW